MTYPQPRSAGERPGSGNGVWHVNVGRLRLDLGRSGTLAVSRIVDQGVLGLASLLLAWRLGIQGFVPVSALLVVNSLSVVGSDFGLGTEFLRKDIGNLSKRTVTRVRVVNGAIAVGAVASGFVLPNAAMPVVVGGGLIWAASGEAFIRKSALIRLGWVGRASVGEMCGSGVLVVGVIIAMFVPDSATWIMVGALVGKHLAESAVNRGWSAVVTNEGADRWDLWLWLNSMLNFAISNVDFVLVAALISSRAFAIYSVGFRVAAAFVAQFSYVVNRVALVDFGDAHRQKSLEDSYRARRRQMARIGIVAGVLTAAVSPLLFLLGDQWHQVVGVVLVLACAIPWRMCAGLGLNVLLAAGGARRAAGWEASRLVGAIVVLAIAAQFNFAVFTVGAVMVAIGTAVGYDRLATSTIGFSGRSLLLITSPFAVGLATVLAWTIL